MKNWLLTGETPEQALEMNLSRAYQTLGLDATLVDGLDDEMIQACFVGASDGVDPFQVQSCERALAVIARHRNSDLLRSWLRDADDAQLPAMATPVGLVNIGNTCYLNSIFQCYYSLTRLRTMILTFHKFKMDINPTTMSTKRVGSRLIEQQEVEESQECKCFCCMLDATINDD